MKSTARGRLSEDLAERLLAAAGYRLIARNVRTAPGEIDILAADGDTLCFVEVKSRTGEAFGPPEEAVTSQKRTRIRRAAAAYLAVHAGAAPSYRFDVIAIDLAPDGSYLQHRLYKDAFT